jgi:chitodextrinase
MPLQATSGAASYDGFGGGVVAEPNYIESVFSTFLYTGNGSTQTITNDIDLSGKGGMVWLKSRSLSAVHTLVDTARGAGKTLFSDLTNAQATNNAVSAFNANGFTMGDYNNSSGDTFASWTFREQPKFFDIVTYTGNGSARTIAHNLGSVPGCMIIKDCTNAGSAWAIYHISQGNTKFLQFTTSAAGTSSTYWNNTTPTSTEFTVGTNGNVNQSGGTYVAYLFAHDAGGFGLTGTDNVISCGSFTTDASSVATVNLGYEPQWVMFKCTSTTDNWRIVDNMRGFANAGSSSDARLFPNLSSQEFFSDTANPTATGFVTQGDLQASQTYIYIAIRRGPMKVPTSGTSVFSPNTANASAGTAIVTNFPVDLSIAQARSAGDPARWEDRLRGVNSPNLSGATPTLRSDSTAAETTASITLGWDNTQIQVPSYYASVDSIWWNFRRAPSFFDEVCYTGTGSATTFSHNLGAVPELMIVKYRADAGNWTVYNASLGNTKYLRLNSTTAEITDPVWNNTTPTSTVFSVGSGQPTNGSGATYVAYLFATCAGVSKVFSYTGNGSSQTINCGFTGGARWILIKRTDSTGDWYVWDTARGIVSGNDPHLSLNSTAAEVTTDDSVDTDSTGFIVNQLSATDINVSSATYIGIAIA